MTKKNEILLPIDGPAVEKFNLQLRAIAIKPTAKRKGRGKRRCRVEVIMDGKSFSLEPAHGGYDSSKRKPFGRYLLRFEGTAHVPGVGGDNGTQIRVARITWRELPKQQLTQTTEERASQTRKTRTSFNRMDRRVEKRVVQGADLD
jgi:hypothetical protein